MVHGRTTAGVAALALALALSACGGGESDEVSESPESDPSPVSVVVIGDSIPFNAAEDCPGCTAFVDSYGTALGEELDATVEVANYSRHDGAKTRDILEQLTAGELTEPLASADVVIVSVGFNDQPPYTDTGQPCHVEEPASAAEAFDAVLDTTEECVSTATRALRETAAEVLREVRAQAPDAAVAGLVPYDSWNGWLGVENTPTAERQAVTRLISYSLVAWREALCAEVDAVDGVCIDVYQAFNGADGRRPSGDLLASDYTHPSQAGNDRIRDLLLEADLVG
ncbi:MAG: SGNH/GDSL hydrolase family protein [Nocardioides sp.]|jgi:lysophospholipase L1-like esterase